MKGGERERPEEARAKLYKSLESDLSMIDDQKRRRGFRQTNKKIETFEIRGGETEGRKTRGNTGDRES